MSSGRWPVSLRADDLAPPLLLRPLHRRDQGAWEILRRDNAAYLARWEPTPPDGTIARTPFGGYVRALNRDARAGNIVPFALELDGQLAGQVHLFGVMRGSLLSGSAGYWLGERFAGQGVATRALAAMVDYALGPFGLHRVEVNIRPENVASLAVVAHLRFRDEGVRQSYLHIEGDWRDHRTFALTVDDLGGRPALDRWQSRG